MTRTILRTSIALPLSLMATAAFAGPPPATGADGSPGGLSLDCTINGRVEHFDLAPGALDQGLQTVTRGGVTYMIEDMTVQVTGGPDAGKWDCVTVASGAAEEGTMAPDPGMMARIVELQGALANAETALRAAQGDRQAAELGRLAAEQARDAALAERDTLQAEVATLTEENRRMRLDAQEMAATQQRVVDLTTELTTGLAQNAALTERVSELQARIAELEAALAAAQTPAQAAPEAMPAEDAEDMPAEEAEDMAAEDTSSPEEDMTPAADPVDTGAAFTVEGFDPSVAQAALDASGLSAIAHDSLSAAVAEAESDPSLLPDVVERLNAALGR